MTMTREKLFSFTVCFNMLVLLCIGCSDNPKRTSSAAAMAEEPGGPALTAEEARNALIELVQKTDDMVLQLSLPSLRAKEAVQVDANEIAIGKWQCDLAGKTFIASVGTAGQFAEYIGVFERSCDGKWHAKITGRKQT